MNQTSILGKRKYKSAFGYDNDYEYYQEQKIEKIIEGKIPFNEEHAKTEKGKRDILRWMQVYKAHVSTKYGIPIQEL
jgi:hypothetical protein